MTIHTEPIHHHLCPGYPADPRTRDEVLAYIDDYEAACAAVLDAQDLVAQSKYDDITAVLLSAGYEPKKVREFCGLLDGDVDADDLEPFLGDGDEPLFGFLLASSTRLSHEATHVLARDPFTPTRLALACSAATPPCVLSELAFDQCLEVLDALISNRNTPKPTLWAMTFHPEHEVRHFAGDFAVEVGPIDEIPDRSVG